MAKIERITEGKNGWSEWLAPRMNNYRLVCCDCGLAHDLDFRVIKRGRGKLGKIQHSTLVGGHGVIFRARRNNRSTARMRANNLAMSKDAFPDWRGVK